jgi:hypothetical protein
VDATEDRSRRIIDWMEALKWVLLVLAAGFIGQFGKRLADFLLARRRERRADEEGRRSDTAHLRASGAAIDGSDALADSSSKAAAKAAKKAAKAEVKRAKKGG